MKTNIAGRPGVLASELSLAAALFVALGLSSLSAAGASGLAALQLGSYYQTEPVSVSAVEKTWNLPVAFQNIPTAARTRTWLRLGDNAWTAIERNGFVVAPFGTATNVIDAYASLRDMGIPLFVTSDTLLHLYHVQFDDVLKCVETNEFLPRLRTMTTVLLDESLRQRSSFSGNLQEAAHRNAACFTVAARLLGLSPTVPPEVDAPAAAELALIASHSGLGASPIFRYQEDYSQYVPRGHYTRGEALQRYFKAMMWYGRMAFLLKGSDNFGPFGEALVSKRDATIQTLQAVLLSLSLDRLQSGNQPIADTWNRIYAVTAFFVGLADDLTPYEYKDAIERLFGTGTQPEIFADEQKLFSLKKELAGLRNPEIFGGTGNCLVAPDATPEELDRVLDKTKGMRVMGQRFIPDSYMFQQLVLPATGPFVGNGQPFTMEVTQGGPRRCFPRGLDVMAVLGSGLALEILDRDGDTAYTGYDVSLSRLVELFNSLAPGDWHRNLYWAWLDALRPLLGPVPAGSPPFMQTPAWQAKQLNAALASWTELRHDTILYAKQSYTPGVTSVPPEPDPGYAEPVPEFYQRLLSLTRMTRTGLDGLQVLNDVQRNRLLSLEGILANLRDIAVAELESRPLTSFQRSFLAQFDKSLAPLTNGIAESIECSTVLVADVHTDGNTGRVLEEGVGYLNVMVVACQLPDGQPMLAAGPVLSYYEFKWPMSDRLTDQAWNALLAGSSALPSPGWTSAFLQPVVLPLADVDGDRLADEWEVACWGGTNVVNSHNGDFDGDGFTNQQEALAGTNPKDASSCLKLLAARRDNDQLQCSWQSAPGRMYRLSCSDDLRSWRLLGPPITASGDTAMATDASAPASCTRFYRIELVR